MNTKATKISVAQNPVMPHMPERINKYALAQTFMCPLVDLTLGIFLLVWLLLNGLFNAAHFPSVYDALTYHPFHFIHLLLPPDSLLRLLLLLKCSFVSWFFCLEAAASTTHARTKMHVQLIEKLCIKSLVCRRFFGRLLPLLFVTQRNLVIAEDRAIKCHKTTAGVVARNYLMLVVHFSIILAK